MIVGGELASTRLTLDAGFHNAAMTLKGVFCSRLADFFIVPPFDERVDLAVEGQYLVFTKQNERPFGYEDARVILDKLKLFGHIKPDIAAEMGHLALANLPCRYTLFFPDTRRTILEFRIFENWARLDFHSEQFEDVAKKLVKDLGSFLPPPLEAVAKGPQEITIRHGAGERLLFSHDVIRKIAAVLVSYALLPPELHQRFVVNAFHFAVMQESRIFLYQGLSALEQDASVGAVKRAGLEAEQAVRVLKKLAEHGEFALLEESDTAFLSHVRLFSDKEFQVFDGVNGLKPFFKNFVSAHQAEITALMDMQLLESGEQEAVGAIDGRTMQEIDQKKEKMRIDGHEQQPVQIKKD